MARAFTILNKDDKGLMTKVEFKVEEPGKADIEGHTHVRSKEFDTDAKIIAELERRFG